MHEYSKEKPPLSRRLQIYFLFIFLSTSCNDFRSVSFSGMSGNLTPPTDTPLYSSASLTGVGDGAENNTSMTGNNVLWIEAAFLIFPDTYAFTISCISFPMTWDATDTIP